MKVRREKITTVMELCVVTFMCDGWSPMMEYKSAENWRNKYWNKQQCFMNELIRDTIRMWATNKCEKKMKIHQLQTKYTTNLNPKSFNWPTHSLIPTFVVIKCTCINDVYLFIYFNYIFSPHASLMKIISIVELFLIGLAKWNVWIW